ncbi:hypothetical protein CBF23_003840 [Marinomonas agarivorans]|nr:hypothetical protein CBF23_003840 [Marinomonas agarivorans]
MDNAEVSLNRLYRKQIAIVLAMAFIAVVFLSVWMMQKQIRQNHQVNLPLYHQITIQAFNAYLKNSEYEMSSAVQALLYNKQQLRPRPVLDVLFDQHDDFLLGGLDFFHISWSDKTETVDPRARLFINEPIENLTAKSIIGGWSLQRTQDGDNLLVYKKSLVQKTMEWQGYLYGFIFLSDNVALANKLLLSAELDAVRLLSPNRDTLFSVTHPDLSVREKNALHFYGVGALIEGIDDAYLLQVAKQEERSSQVMRQYTVWIAVCFIILVAVFLVLTKLFGYSLKKTLFTFEQDLDAARNSSFSELYSLQKRMNEDNAKLNAQLSSFDLLMEASRSAIIFCDDTAGIKQINKKAEDLFAESIRSRTVFDFMPVACHPAIQQALKGEVGISFEMTLANSNSIYNWRLFPYMTENYHRGVALIGSDVTTMQQLQWQLSELQQYAPENSVEPQLILAELAYVLENMSDKSRDIWLNALIQCVNELLNKSTLSAVIPLGDLLDARLQVTPCDLAEVGFIQLSCAIQSANVHGTWSSDIGLLISTLIMMIHSSDTVSQKRLAIEIFDDQIKFEATGVASRRPVFKSLLYAVSARLGIECRFINNNQLVVLYPFLEKTFTTDNPVATKKIAWIKNDYRAPELLEEALQRLDCHVTHFSSSESFFTEFSGLDKVDALLIGYEDYQANFSELPTILKTRLDRTDLPIGWVNHGVNQPVDNYPSYFYQPYDYGVAKFLENICRHPPIDLKAGLIGRDGWLLVGGSKVSRAILYEELLRQELTPYPVEDIQEHESLLSNKMVRVVLLLDNIEQNYIVQLGKRYSDLIILSLDITFQNEIIYNYPLERPYQKEQIKLLAEFVQKKLTEE